MAYQANARSGNRKQKDREEVNHTTKKPWRQKGTGRARAGMSSSPLWRGGGRIFPNSPEENFTHKVNKKMYRAGLCSILSQLAREGRISVVEELTIEAPKTKLLSEKLKAMGLDSVLVITDTLDENLLLASRNLPTCWLSNHVTQIRCPWCSTRRSWSPRLHWLRLRRCWHERIEMSEERLMKVLLAPVISEKATMVAEKNEQIVFRVAPDATKPEIKAAVELLFKVEVVSVQPSIAKGKQKRTGRTSAVATIPRRFRVPEAWPGNQFDEEAK